MSKHYKQIKEEKTLKLVKRACSFLVDVVPPIKLNGKTHKKINFSHPQVLNCMHTIAKNEERSEGLLFRDASTITHSKNYKKAIADAKVLRAEKEGEKLNIEFEGEEPDMLDMKIMINSMVAQLDALKEKNASLEAIIDKAELREAIEEKSGPVSIHHETSTKEDQKIRELLARLLVALSDEYILMVEPKKNGKSAVAKLMLPDGIKHFCKLSDLQALNLEFTNDCDNRILVEHKTEDKERR